MKESPLQIMKIQKKIDEIQVRNARVEADKAWETSWTRRLLILTLTYIVVVLFFFVAKLPHPFINAAVPSVGFFLSTLGISVVKQQWLRKFNKIL